MLGLTLAVLGIGIIVCCFLDKIAHELEEIKKELWGIKK